MPQPRINRRQALQVGACAAFATLPGFRAMAEDNHRLFKVGACDWSLGLQHQLAALECAKTVGLDGVQVSFGEEDIRYDLRRPSVRKEYSDLGKQLDVEIASLAMGILNNKPYASDPDAERWVSDCVDVMEKMGQKIVLLAFFSQGDIKNKPDAQKEVIRRLKKVATKAEKAGVILGIESWLNADDHIRILDAVGSPAVKVYYDVANMEHQGYDIYKEIRQLGKDRICEVHAKENGFLLGQGKVDFPKVKAALDDIGWCGWLIVEGATVSGKTLKQCYKHNQEYIRSVFPT